jgi:hypothetical protein
MGLSAGTMAASTSALITSNTFGTVNTGMSASGQAAV